MDAGGGGVFSAQNRSATTVPQGGRGPFLWTIPEQSRKGAGAVPEQFSVYYLEYFKVCCTGDHDILFQEFSSLPSICIHVTPHHKVHFE